MGEYYLGIDLGGTKIAGLIGDEQGKIIAEDHFSLAEEGVEPVINRIKI